MLTGGCYCGAVRYQAEGEPFHQTICHCEMCRRTTGAPCVAWFSVATTGFTLTGERAVRYRSSSHATRCFCSACGTQLTFAEDATPGEIDVTICSLDQPGDLAPADHSFTVSQVPWLHCADGLPRFARSRAEEEK